MCSPLGLSWGQKLWPAFFLERPNRFLTLVRLCSQASVGPDGCCLSGCQGPGPVVEAHLGDPGRLKEILVPGRPVWLRAARPGEGQGRLTRKTAFSLVMADMDGVLVSLDSQAPNRLVRKALAAGYFPDLKKYSQVWPEARFGASRLDFRLTGAAGVPDLLMEVKSVTLVQAGRALFPDAPTARGVRHLGELAAACREGLGAAVVFIIQRADARGFAPHDAMDKDFGQALRQAAASGVKVWAYSCQVTADGIGLLGAIPVHLD